MLIMSTDAPTTALDTRDDPSRAGPSKLTSMGGKSSLQRPISSYKNTNNRVMTREIYAENDDYGDHGRFP